MKVKVCICGGGSQSHISAGVIGSNPDYEVSILTRHPEKWSHEFKTVDLDGKEYKAHIETITADPGEVIPNSDIVLIALPGFAIKDVLTKIAPFCTPNHIIGCVFGGSGFFIAVQQILGKEVKAFALQRVPYTGRPI